MEPARATVERLAPERRRRSSGLAPMKAASGVPQQKQKQEENCSRIAPNRAAGSWAAPALTSTSRASTTLDISPASIRAVAVAIVCSKSTGGRTLLISTREVGWGSSSGNGSERKPASRASTAPTLAPVLAGVDDRVERREGLLAAAADRELGQDQRGRRQRRPGRGTTPFRVEGETANPDRTGTGRQSRRLVDDRVGATSTRARHRESESARATSPHGPHRESQARTGGRAAPSRTSDRWQAVRRTPPRRDRSPRRGR